MIIPVLAGGGAERVVSNLSLTLYKQYDIDILLDYNKIGYEYKGNIIYVMKNTSIEPIGLQKVWMYIKKWIMLTNLKRKHKYNVYISHSGLSDLINILSGYRHKNVIVTLHNEIAGKIFTKTRRNLNYYIKKYILKHAPKIITVSKGIANEITTLYNINKNRIFPIWNGCDLANIQNLAAQPLTQEQMQWFEENKKTIVLVGRYTKQKAQWHLIRAFSKVLESIPDTRLLLIGEGEYRAYYENLISSLNLQESVFLCGFQQNPFSVITRCDISVVSSLWEGLSYALIESICCNVPCIATDFNYGAREIFEYNSSANKLEHNFKVLDYGVLTPLCSGTKYSGHEPLEEAEKLLANSICFLLNNPEIGKNIVKKNQERLNIFSVDNMAKKWQTVIERQL